MQGTKGVGEHRPGAEKGPNQEEVFEKLKLELIDHIQDVIEAEMFKRPVDAAKIARAVKEMDHKMLSSILEHGVLKVGGVGEITFTGIRKVADAYEAQEKAITATYPKRLRDSIVGSRAVNFQKKHDSDITARLKKLSLVPTQWSSVEIPVPPPPPPVPEVPAPPTPQAEAEVQSVLQLSEKDIVGSPTPEAEPTSPVEISKAIVEAYKKANPEMLVLIDILTGPKAVSFAAEVVSGGGFKVTVAGSGKITEDVKSKESEGNQYESDEVSKVVLLVHFLHDQSKKAKVSVPWIKPILTSTGGQTAWAKAQGLERGLGKQLPTDSININSKGEGVVDYGDGKGEQVAIDKDGKVTPEFRAWFNAG